MNHGGGGGGGTQNPPGTRRGGGGYHGGGGGGAGEGVRQCWPIYRVHRVDGVWSVCHLPSSLATTLQGCNGSTSSVGLTHPESGLGFRVQGLGFRGDGIIINGPKTERQGSALVVQRPSGMALCSILCPR